MSARAHSTYSSCHLSRPLFVFSCCPQCLLSQQTGMYCRQRCISLDSMSANNQFTHCHLSPVSVRRNSDDSSWRVRPPNSRYASVIVSADIDESSYPVVEFGAENCCRRHFLNRFCRAPSKLRRYSSMHCRYSSKCSSAISR